MTKMINESQIKQINTLVGLYAADTLNAAATAAAICGTIGEAVDDSELAEILGKRKSDLPGDAFKTLIQSVQSARKKAQAKTAAFRVEVVPAKDPYPELVKISGGAYNCRAKKISPRFMLNILESPENCETVLTTCRKMTEG